MDIQTLSKMVAPLGTVYPRYYEYDVSDKDLQRNFIEVQRSHRHRQLWHEVDSAALRVSIVESAFMLDQIRCKRRFLNTSLIIARI